MSHGGATDSWPRSLQASDGMLYRVRPINPGDAQREREFIMGLSPESRFQRLMHAVREPSAEFVARMVNVDQRHDMALVAVTGDQANEMFIAVARYAADEHGHACEFAVAVADAWQCRGLGSTLATLLIEHAAKQGYGVIYGTVLANNQRMIDLFEWLGFTIEPREEGSTTVRASRRLT